MSDLPSESQMAARFEARTARHERCRPRQSAWPAHTRGGSFVAAEVVCGLPMDLLDRVRDRLMMTRLPVRTCIPFEREDDFDGSVSDLSRGIGSNDRLILEVCSVDGDSERARCRGSPTQVSAGFDKVGTGRRPYEVGAAAGHDLDCDVLTAPIPYHQSASVCASRAPLCESQGHEREQESLSTRPFTGHGSRVPPPGKYGWNHPSSRCPQRSQTSCPRRHPHPAALSKPPLHHMHR
jgi:hypothetical protein